MSEDESTVALQAEQVLHFIMNDGIHFIRIEVSVLSSKLLVVRQ
jgi:hypothetical protein